ncbi:MAG: hypothetical protein ACREAC_25490, partial [Blastocatellia bacterium]
LMLFDEPTGGLDPINNRQVLNLVIRARDVHQISSLYVTKEMHEIPYLATHVAERTDGAVTINRAESSELPAVRVLVLNEGQVAFVGAASEFESSSEDAVLNLTSPHTSVRTSHQWRRDPWSRRGTTTRNK